MVVIIFNENCKQNHGVWRWKENCDTILIEKSLNPIKGTVLTLPNWFIKGIKVWDFTVGFYALELYRAYSIIFILHYLKPFNNSLKAFE